jgi:hypothetical protein
MGTYTVRIEEENIIAVFQSTSGTMFSPTWDEDHEIDAQIFACLYGSYPRYLAHDDYNDEGQDRIAQEIREFLDEQLGSNRADDSADLVKMPQAWNEALKPAYFADEECFDVNVSDVVHGNGDARLFILERFKEWLAVRRPETALTATERVQEKIARTRALSDQFRVLVSEHPEHIDRLYATLSGALQAHVSNEQFASALETVQQFAADLTATK